MGVLLSVGRDMETELTDTVWLEILDSVLFAIIFVDECFIDFLLHDSVKTFIA